MSIKFPAVLLFAALAISMISAFSLIDDAAAEIISVQNIKITGPTEITVTFSEKVDVENDGSQFVDLVLSTAPGERNVMSAKEVSNKATVWKLTFAGGDAKPSDTATIDIGTGVKEITSSTNKTNVFAGINDKAVADGQKPALIKDSPVLFTGPNEMTIKFTELVTATTEHFSDLTVGDKDDTREITSVDGSGTETIVLTFDGEIVAPGQKEGAITINMNVTDSAKNTLAKTDTQRGSNNNSFDGQIPYLISASIVDKNEVELVFSEDIEKATKEYFNFTSGSDREVEKVEFTKDKDNKEVNSKLTLTIGGTGIDVDATGTIDIKSIMDKSDNGLEPLTNEPVKAAQRPLLESAELIKPTEIELKFSELLDEKSIIGSSFTDLNLSSTSNTDFKLGKINGNTDTVTLKLTTAVVGTDVTGTLYITGHLNDTQGNNFAGTTVNIQDAQKPTLTTIEITDPNTITATFSESVMATTDDFTDFSIKEERSITNIDGSGSSTIVLTFGGEPVEGDAKGKITLGSKITDLSTLKNQLVSIPKKDVADGQSPTVEWAGITNQYEFTINFSENVEEPESLKSTGKVHLDQLDEDRQIVRIAYDKTAGNVVIKDTLVVDFSKFDDNDVKVPASVTETGSVVITTIKDPTGNSLVPVKQDLVAAQSPLLSSASIIDEQTVELVFSEEVKALASAFSALNLDDGTQVQITKFTPIDKFSKTYNLTTHSSLDTGASGSITITAGLYDNDVPVRYFVEGTHTVSDKQPPTLVSASITGSNTITATFSEPVKAAPDDFTLLEIVKDSEARSITDVSGSDTTEIMLTFNGTAVSTDATGSIEIAATDLASNLFTSDKTPTEVTDGQAPIIKRAEVNNGIGLPWLQRVTEN